MLKIHCPYCVSHNLGQPRSKLAELSRYGLEEYVEHTTTQHFMDRKVAERQFNELILVWGENQ
jgi:hypothetical protein